MKKYLINPEVPGGWGENIIVDRNFHPPIISKLHLEFDGWLEDDLITSFPVYAVTKRLKELIEDKGLTGISFDSIEVTFSQFFKDLYGNKYVPKFFWMKVFGNDSSDFHLLNGYNLIVSEKAKNILLECNFKFGEIKEYFP